MTWSAGASSVTRPTSPSPGWPASWAGRRPPAWPVRPLAAARAGGWCTVTMHDIPADAVLEVRIEHPEYRWFANLGLRWYAVPVISGMYLDIGGVRYPAAPFNGWYMGTEIGSRDFGDTGRYDELREIATHLGLSTATDRTLWKDKALTELNLAVLHSFDARRRLDHRPPHRVGPLPPAPASGRSGTAAAARWTGPGSCLRPRPRPRRSSTAPTADLTRRRTSPPPRPVAGPAAADDSGSPAQLAPPRPPTSSPVSRSSRPHSVRRRSPQPRSPGLAGAGLAHPFLAHAGLAQPARASAARGRSPAALCPHQSGDHVPHLRMIEEQGRGGRSRLRDLLCKSHASCTTKTSVS